jgi:hypothetical protein
MRYSELKEKVDRLEELKDCHGSEACELTFEILKELLEMLRSLMD